MVTEPAESDLTILAYLDEIAARIKNVVEPFPAVFV